MKTVVKWTTILQVILGILAVAILLVGCAPGVPVEATGENPGPDVYFQAGSDEVYRFVDSDYRNVCYIVNGASSGGIYCLPIE